MNRRQTVLVVTMRGTKEPFIDGIKRRKVPLFSWVMSPDIFKASAVVYVITNSASTADALKLPGDK